MTFGEYENGVHYDLVNDRLAEAGYDEPFVHFDQFEGPGFLHAAVRQYLGIPSAKADQPITLTPENP